MLKKKRLVKFKAKNWSEGKQEQKQAQHFPGEEQDQDEAQHILKRKARSETRSAYLRGEIKTMNKFGIPKERNQDQIMDML